MRLRAAVGFAGITFRNFWAGKRSVAALLLLLLPAVIVGLVALTSSRVRGTFLFHGVAFNYSLWFMLYLLTLIYGIALTSGEIEEGTVGYLYLGALPRWQIVIIQIAVSALVLTALAGLSVLLTGLAASLSDQGAPEDLWRDVWGFTLVAGIGILVSLAFYASCGLAFRSPMPAAVLATFFWELMVTIMPVKFAAWTVTNNLRALMLPLVFDGQPGRWYRYKQDAYEMPSYGAAAMYLSVLAGLFLVTAMVAAMNRSIQGKEAR